MRVQPLPQMREVCFLRYVQCQRGAVFGLRPVGNGVPRLLPSVRRKLPDCRVYLICEDGHPGKLPALEKAVELKLIDGFCIGDLAAEQMRTWLSETAETISGRSAR